MPAASSRAAALETLVIMTMPSLLPACVQATPEAKKMRPPHVLISSHKLRIGRVLRAGFDRRLLALRQVRARCLRPAVRLTVASTGRSKPTRLDDELGEEMWISALSDGKARLQGSVCSCAPSAYKKKQKGGHSGPGSMVGSWCASLCAFLAPLTVVSPSAWSCHAVCLRMVYSTVP